ncbi:hypothetical protein DAKH74_014880 [Maudiozyma humilis]|uniref:Cell wall mannoprotein PIR1-like C-terminal domain-containing protein n=1 Tax=Maudiozyma humilis TaxID=51915 RepID=A0AAV5RU83_MAUHU|nr:hypothetical protein DAKH74_014880 [Kazachstania humilis]
MQYKKTLASATLAATALAAYVPPEPWSTLTPSGTCPGGFTDYTSTFGIAVEPITTAVSKAKRAVVSQIGDGQIQVTTATVDTTVTTVTKNGGTVTTIVNAPTKAAVSQIGDGQIQAGTKPAAAAPAAAKPTVAAVSQITDGQIQAPTKPAAAAPAPAAPKPNGPAPVSQITDGQIQAPTKPATAAPAPAAPKPNGPAPVSQITDGQIQAPTKPATAAPAPAAPKPNGPAPVSQITDGQIQAPTKPATAAPAAAKPTAAAVSQITDGQIQATHPASVAAVSQIHDGQAQATKAVSGSSPAPSGSNPVTAQSCKNAGTLELTIKGGVLTDAKGRIGSIVANRQFQFDGPPPQAGAIYAKGWSISPEGNLALGSSDVFYQCLSGNFYNLYDEDIGHQCSPVHLSAIDLVSC